VLIGVITLVNAGSSVRLVYAIITTEPFTNDANTLLVSGGIIWLTNVIAFGLWYWNLDRGGAAARALGTGKPWAKLLMMAEETISVVVGILVVARAVNILK
jgi:hypothetical protein